MLDFCAEHGIVVRHRDDPDPEDQRGLRADAEERREVPLRDRHGVAQARVTGERRPIGNGALRHGAAQGVRRHRRRGRHLVRGGAPEIVDCWGRTARARPRPSTWSWACSPHRRDDPHRGHRPRTPSGAALGGPTSPPSTRRCRETSPSRRTCASSASCYGVTRPARSASRSCSRSSTSSASATRSAACCPRASRRASRWPRRCSTGRTCCCSTSPPRRSTRPRRTTSAPHPRLRGARATAACCGPRTTCTRSRRSATACSSSRTARILLEGDPKTLPREHGKATLEELFITVAREPLALERS